MPVDATVLMVGAGPTGLLLTDATIVLTTRSGDRHGWGWLEPAAAEQPGIGEISLLVVRPDGHVGLRADRDHLAALDAYHALVASGRRVR